MQHEIISIVKERLQSVPGVSLYLVGSAAYQGFQSAWSDLDIVVLAESRDRNLLRKLNAIMHEVNLRYRGVVAGGGDQTLDLIPIFKDEFQTVVKSPYYFSEKYKIIVYILEIMMNGKLICGNDQMDWVKKEYSRLDQRMIGNTLLQNCYERIHLYHNVYSHIPKMPGSIDKYAPHKKYKVIPMLFISMVRVLLWIKHGVYVRKNNALEQFRKYYPNLFPEIDKAFKLRETWNSASKYHELENITKRLPFIIEWFLLQTKPESDLDYMIFIRGRKEWHYRERDRRRVIDFLKDYQLTPEEINPYLFLEGTNEIAFLELCNEIIAVALLEFTETNMRVHRIASRYSIGYQVFDYYLYHRAYEKNKDNIQFECGLQDEYLSSFRWIEPHLSIKSKGSIKSL